MSRMTLDRLQPTAFAEVPPSLYRLHESPLPEKPAAEACCPNCQQPLPHTNSTPLHSLKSGFAQLITAVLVIVFSILRLARLIVAMAFSFIGLAGFGIQNIAGVLVHPDDRQLLPIKKQNQ